MVSQARGMWELNFSSDDDDDEGNGEDVAPPEHAATQRHKDASALVHKAAADRHAAQPHVTTHEHQGADAQHEAVTAQHEDGAVIPRRALAVVPVEAMTAELHEMVAPGQCATGLELHTVPEAVQHSVCTQHKDATVQSGAMGAHRGATEARRSAPTARDDDQSEAAGDASKQGVPPDQPATVARLHGPQLRPRAPKAYPFSTKVAQIGPRPVVEVGGEVVVDNMLAGKGVRLTRAMATRGALTPDEEASSRKLPRMTSPSCEFATMGSENARVLAQDKYGTWCKGVRRFRANRESAAKVLSWVVDNTSRTLSVAATDALTLDGFQDWGMVHAGTLDNERQLQHTFVISRAQRRRALKAIPGLADIVSATQAEIESLRLHDTPTKLEWLTGHILNQGDVNARFEYHQDTDEERKEVGGRRDRRVLYTAIVKLNSGGCTSMQVYGHPEVFYYAHGGCSVIFRSDLHHRTEKAEPGIWKLALFFGLFL